MFTRTPTTAVLGEPSKRLTSTGCPYSYKVSADYATPLRKLRIPAVPTFRFSVSYKMSPTGRSFPANARPSRVAKGDGSPSSQENRALNSARIEGVWAEGGQWGI